MPFWGAPSPAVLQCPEAKVGWLGGAVPPPPPAWQPGTHRWQRLGSRRGGICAFAPAAHGALPGTGRSERGEAGRRGCPQPPNPADLGYPRGQHPFPLQGATGMRWDAGGHCSSSGSAGTGTPPTLGGILEPQGSSRHLHPCTGVRADAETPNTQPHTGEGRAGAGRYSHPGPSERIWPRGARAEGPEHPTCPPPRRAGQRIPGSGGGCSQRSRKQPLDFITHFLTWLPGDKRLEETGFHFPPPQQGASAPPRAPLSPPTRGRGDTPGGRAASRPRVPTALLAGSGHWHVAGIISAQPWPAGSVPGPAQSEPRLSAPFIHRRGATRAGHRQGLGVRCHRGQGLGVRPHHDAHGLAPGAGAVGTGTTGDTNHLAQAQAPACSATAAGPAQPACTAKSGSGQRGCWLWGAGGAQEGVPPHPAICRVLGAAGTNRHIPSLCQQPPHRGVQRLWVVHGGVGCSGGTLGAPGRH
ncbi:uncharacterized protein ACIBXB_022055 [Morphnus guianensis]